MATGTQPQLEARSVDLADESADAIPPLENGDKLTRFEFERRYTAMPELKKAELLEGMVYLMSSPVSQKRHGRPHLMVCGWIDRYLEQTPGVDAGDNTTLRLDLDNEPQPDCMLYITPECGGTVKISEGDILEGAPELIFEVASSRASYDLHTKLHVYRRSGVNEYVVWRTRERIIDWFVLRDGNYVQQTMTPAGFHQSTIFPGLWLDVAAMLGFDRKALSACLAQGTSSPEHAAFVARLAARAGTHSSSLAS